MKKSLLQNSLFFLFFFATCFCLSSKLLAQDLIVFSDGTIEQAKILEVGDDVIKYKKWTNQDGPTFTANKPRVFSIKYQDGTEEKFVNQQQNTTNTYQNTTNTYQTAQNRTPGYPQTRDGGFSIHFGGAFPVGDFGEEVGLDDWPGKGFSAGPGFNIGLKGKIPVPVNGLGVFISGDFIYNGLKGKLKDQYDELQEELEDEDGTLEQRSRYINVPLFVGLNYKYNFSQLFGLWGEFGLGPNFRIITPTKMEYYDDYGDYEEEEYKYKMQTSFAFQVGAGIMINNLFSIGLHYYGLGKAKIKEKGSDNDDYYDDDWKIRDYGDDPSSSSSSKKYAQSCFMVRLGFHF